MRPTVIDGRSIDQFIPSHLREMFYHNPIPQYKYATHDGYDPYGFSTKGLAMYLPLWALNNGGTNSIQSVDAYKHTGTITGALWSPIGRLFTGDDVITIPNATSLNITGTVTVEAWLYLTAGQATSRSIAIQTGGDPFYFYGLRIIGGKLASQVYVDGVANRADANDAYTAATWTHVVGLYNGANIHLYVDTVLQTDQPADTGAIAVGAGAFTIGAWQTSEFFEGTIGEVRVYNRALSLAEITHNRNATIWRY